MDFLKKCFRFVAPAAPAPRNRASSTPATTRQQPAATQQNSRMPRAAGAQSTTTPANRNPPMQTASRGNAPTEAPKPNPSPAPGASITPEKSKECKPKMTPEEKKKGSKASSESPMKPFAAMDNKGGKEGEKISDARVKSAESQVNPEPATQTPDDEFKKLSPDAFLEYAILKRRNLLLERVNRELSSTDFACECFRLWLHFDKLVKAKQWVSQSRKQFRNVVLLPDSTQTTEDDSTDDATKCAYCKEKLSDLCLDCRDENKTSCPLATCSTCATTYHGHCGDVMASKHLCFGDGTDHEFTKADEKKNAST